MSTITIQPHFSVNGHPVMDGCFADDVFKGFFAHSQFKTLLAQTVETGKANDLNIDTVQTMFHHYLMDDLMTDTIGHELMGEFLQTYDSTIIDQVKFIHAGDNETINLSIMLTTKENVTADEREDRRNLAAVSVLSQDIDEDIDEDFADDMVDDRSYETENENHILR